MTGTFPGEDRGVGAAASCRSLGEAVTWGEEGDGLHQHILLLMQLQLLQHAVEFYHRIQQKFLEATCG